MGNDNGMDKTAKSGSRGMYAGGRGGGECRENEERMTFDAAPQAVAIRDIYVQHIKR
jgi:hypothetical protein